LSWLVQYSGSANVTTNLHRYELVEGGKLLATQFEELRVRSYEPAEFGNLLEAAGFRQIEAFKPYANEPLDASDDAIVFSARKA
jgi:hypothetical protein